MIFFWGCWMLLSDKSYFCSHSKIHKLKPNFPALIECGLWCWLHGWCGLGLSDSEWAKKYNKSKLSVIKAFEFFWWSQKHHHFRISLKLFLPTITEIVLKNSFQIHFVGSCWRMSSQARSCLFIFGILFLFQWKLRCLVIIESFILIIKALLDFFTFYIRTFVHHCLSSYCSMFSEISTSRLFV